MQKSCPKTSSSFLKAAKQYNQPVAEGEHPKKQFVFCYQDQAWPNMLCSVKKW
jgi:hypothetical protein